MTKDFPFQQKLAGPSGVSGFDYFLRTKAWNPNSVILISLKGGSIGTCDALCRAKTGTLLKDGHQLDVVQPDGKLISKYYPNFIFSLKSYDGFCVDLPTCSP